MTQLIEQLAAASDEVTLTWMVTQDDIDQGEKEDCFTCPVARSLVRELPGIVPEVDARQLVLHAHDPVTDGPGPSEWVADTPRNVETFIMDVDDGEPVGPIEVTATFRRVP